MQVLLDRVQLNRWDKDSIRPGPVGSVGDVNLQVTLKRHTYLIDTRKSSLVKTKFGLGQTLVMVNGLVLLLEEEER